MNLLFLLLLAAVLIQHYTIYRQFNLNYIDSDQAFMWLGAKDFLNGNFYEPRYYGQNYNTFLEAMFAVPLMWLGLKVNEAVPLATHMLFLFPYVFTSCYLMARKKPISASLVLVILLAACRSHDLLVSLPRGFVTGLFFTGFSVISIVRPQSLTWAGVNGALYTIGYYVNPNSLLVSAPVLFYLFMHNNRNSKFYFAMLTVPVFALLSFFFFDRFYHKHPDYIINGLDLNFSAGFFWLNISNLDQKFAHISFFADRKSWSVILAIAALIVLAYKFNKNAFAAMLVFMAVLLLAFFSGKTMEGSDNVFMSVSRMYLGIPLILALFIASLPEPGLKVPFAAAALTVLGFTFYKLYNIEQTIDKHFSKPNEVSVRLLTMKQTTDFLQFYNRHAKSLNCSLLVVSQHQWLHNVLAYGGPALYDDFPQTIETTHEKRYWVRERSRQQYPDRFLIVSCNFTVDKRFKTPQPFKLTPVDLCGLFLVTENKLSLAEFRERLNKAELDLY